MTETSETFIPRTISDLIAQAEQIGGEVTEVSPRRFEFALPCKVADGSIKLVSRAAVGYYVKDGKNVIRGTREVRTEIAYWARQSR